MSLEASKRAADYKPQRDRFKFIQGPRHLDQSARHLYGVGLLFAGENNLPKSMFFKASASNKAELSPPIQKAAPSLVAGNFARLTNLISDQQMIPDSQQTVSRGVVGFRAPTLAKIILTHHLYNHPWVSVGSGNGQVEKALREDGLKMTTIEPFPNAFNPLEEQIQPDFDYVDSYITASENSQPPQNLVLLLNWAEPSLDYDQEAIDKLQPQFILSVYETSGGAGVSVTMELERGFLT